MRSIKEMKEYDSMGCGAAEGSVTSSKVHAQRKMKIIDASHTARI